jgi:hypothetical protein
MCALHQYQSVFQILHELVKSHQQHLNGRLPDYDGKKSLFTAGSLHLKSKDFALKLTNPERTNQGYDVSLQPVHVTFTPVMCL